MKDETIYLTRLARKVAKPYMALSELRAAMLTGSVSEGESDFYSDLDIILYFETIPSIEILQKAREENGGSELFMQLGHPDEAHYIESYFVHGVECQFGMTTVSAWEEDVATVLVKLDVESVLQKALSGMESCIPLIGEGLIATLKQQAANYPHSLSRAMVEKYLHFPSVASLWNRLESRDATIWRQSAMVESSQNILGVLAGLNQLYYTTFQFKRMNIFINKMQIAPPELSSRIESLFTLPARECCEELEKLIVEVVELVEKEMPDVDTCKTKKRLGWRYPRWQIDKAAFQDE